MLITYTSICFPSGRFKVGQNTMWKTFDNDKKPTSVKDLFNYSFTIYGQDWTTGLYSMKRDYITDISKIP